MDGRTIALIVFAVVAVLFVVICYIVSRFVNIGDLVKGSKVNKDDKPCVQSIDCANYGLNSTWICDPPTKQCKIRPYTVLPCTSNTQCPEVTPICMKGLCQKQEYISGVLEGDASKGCNGSLVVNAIYNFCQSRLGGLCTNNDDCFQGVCQSGRCATLHPLDPCPTNTYGNQPCDFGLTCIPDKLGVNGKCQIAAGNGVKGSYCFTNDQCGKGLICNHASSDASIGVCGFQDVLYGQFCDQDAECSPGLRCDTTNHECVFIPLDSGSLSNSQCPPSQYGSGSATQGCSNGKTSAPCSDVSRCAINCSLNTFNAIANLTLGFLGPDQVWRSMNILSTFFTTNFEVGTGGLLKPKDTSVILKYAPNISIDAASYTYPSFNLTTRPDPTIKAQIGALEQRACQPYPTPAATFTHLPMTAQHVLFKIKYTSTDLSSTGTFIEITFIDANQVTGPANTVVGPLFNNDFLTDYFVNAGSPLPTTPRYVCNNYLKAGPRNVFSFPASPADRVGWGGATINTVPPPISETITSRYNGVVHIGGTGPKVYYEKCLQFSEASANSFPFLHFFYNPEVGETVTKYFFLTVPFKTNGGLICLVGVFNVNDSEGTKIVISTMTLYADSSDTDQRTISNTVIMEDDSNTFGNPFSVRVLIQKPIYMSTTSSTAIYASIYSFTLMRFPNASNLAKAFPFMANMTVEKPLVSEAVGNCHLKIGYDPTKTGYNIVSNLDNLNDVTTPFATPLLSSVFKPFPILRGQEFIPADATLSKFYDPSNGPYSLQDIDLLIYDDVGTGAIVGLILNVSNGSAQSDTYIATLRYGYISLLNAYADLDILPSSYPKNNTRMYTFYMTPEPEQQGEPVVEPNVAYAPVSTTDIEKNWLPPDANPNPNPLPAPGTLPSWYKVSHTARTSWSSETFTLGVVPYNLKPPIRFHRNYNPDNVYQPAEIYILGNTTDPTTGIATGDMIVIPVNFDMYGSVSLEYFPSVTDPSQKWYSLDKSCPTKSIDSINMIIPNPNDAVTLRVSGTVITPPTWTINIVPIQNSSNLTLNSQAFMCETSGYPDGIIIKARPYIFRHNYPVFNPNEWNPSYATEVVNTSPINITNVKDFGFSQVLLGAGATAGNVADYISHVAMNTPEIMGIPRNLSGPMILPGVFTNNVFVGSECSTGMMAGAYKYKGTCIIANAQPFANNSVYPVNCPDYNPNFIPKSLPIMVAYANPNTTLSLYNIKINRATNTLTLVSKDVQTFDNSPFVIPVDTCGTPIVIYSGCV